MKEDILSFLDSFSSDLGAILPRLLASVVILIVGYLVGRLAALLVRRFILYLDRIINDKLSQQLLKVDLHGPSKVISRTLFWIILVIALVICTQILQLQLLNRWIEELVSYLPRVFVSVVIIFVGIISGRLLGDIIKSATSRTALANGKYVGRAVRFLILFITIVIAVDQLGINIGFLTNLVIILLTVLLLGASLAFGLGAQTSVRNILGAYYARKTYKPGDRIKVGEHSGVVVRFSDHSLILETTDGLVVIPAKDLNEMQVTILNQD